MFGLGILALAWLAGILAVVVRYRRDLLAAWREAVLRCPILIIESDDWGAGPVAPQVEALSQLHAVLTRHRDITGRHPVMTLALILAVPDGPAIRRDGQYRRCTLSDPMFAPVLETIDRGAQAGVFVLQLHGLEHYWRHTLLAVGDPQVRAWLEGNPPASTEQLPSHLQSRWVDTSTLPSRVLPREQIADAVVHEVALYREIVGQVPRVAVPPTFVWSDVVEAAWARQGIEIVVTPGHRFVCRDASGQPSCRTGPVLNGQLSNGVTHVVRDDYFEPERGHRAERALAALAKKWKQGRPCLLETHRSNFIGDPEQTAASIAETDRLITLALDGYPSLRFLSTYELGLAMKERDPAWVEQDIVVRFHAWIERARVIPGFSRLAKWTGLISVITLITLPLRAVARPNVP